MISGVSFNVFNGEEHLVHAIRSIREQINYINIVVQFISNLGNRCSLALEEVMDLIHKENLVDQVFVYDPDLSLSPLINELKKRNIGLNLAKRAGVTHFMTMDCDEYYLASEIANAKVLIENHKIRATAVRTYLHIKRPIYRSKFPDPTCCAFLTEIDKGSELTLNANYPYLVDQTRRITNQQHVCMIPTSIISMKHMNLVRKNLKNKLDNSTNAHAVGFMNAVAESVGGWEYGQIFRFPNKPDMEIVKVDDIFEIDSIFK